MSDEKNDDPSADDSFEVRLWLCELKISDPGIQKVLKNEISDKKCLLSLSSGDIEELKLAVGDRRRFVDGIEILQGTTTEKPVSKPEGEQVSPNPVPVDDQSLGEEKTTFSIEDVAKFLAGNPVPQNVKAAILNVQTSQPIANATDVNAAAALQQPPPVCNRFPVSAQVPSPGHQFASRFPNLGLPPPVSQYRPPYGHPWYPPTNHQLGYSGYQQNYNQTVPIYSPQRHQNIPSRVSNTQLGRDTNQFDGYQSSMTNDLFAINQYDPAFQSGEPLFLPCNFISHVRGSARSEDEELFRTSSGTKLYLGQGGMKNKPEKLSYGLFFGANGRILARLVPNLTPDLACYLDYLRKIGDLMLNYTASSVFLLDHEHRFEVVEQPDKSGIKLIRLCV